MPSIELRAGRVDPTGRVRSPLPLRPPPPLEPPFDDELPDLWPPSRGQLSLDFAPRRTPVTRRSLPSVAVPPLAPPVVAGRRSAGIGSTPPVTVRAPDPGQPTGAATVLVPLPGGVLVLPAAAIAGSSAEAKAAARRFLGVSVEILNGYRPAAHARPLSRPMEAPSIVAEMRAATRRLRGSRARSVRAAPPAPASAANLIRPRQLRVCEPRPGAAEAVALLDVPDGVRAMAFRIERLRGAWLCTAAGLL